MEKTIAVVVSYNRQSLLAECIDALRKQTQKPDAILVINNGSTDRTAEWLSKQTDVNFITQANLGSAGGFNTGIKWAYENGYSWIWCMDDDGYPHPAALQNLLANEPLQHRALLNCAVLNKEDKRTFVWKTAAYKTIDEARENRIEGVGHPFNGTLIHRSIVEKAGLPKGSLFLWGDETEYYYRITRKYLYPVYTIPSSIHYHPAAAFNLRKDWDYQQTWKMYFYIRNRLHIHRAKFKTLLLSYLHYSCFLVALTGVILLFQKTDRIKKIGFLFWPVKDAVSHNYKATPTQIIQKLNRQENSWKLPVVSLRTKWEQLIHALRLRPQRDTANLT